MNSAGKIISLQLCPGHRKPMKPVEEAEAIRNLGLKDDRHALPDSSRQVLLIEKETLDHFGLAPGQVKENITTTNISVMALGTKQRIRLGKDVILEVTKSCSPCSRMDEIRQGLQRDLAGKRGMLARVVAGGIIRNGDVIAVLD